MMIESKNTMMPLPAAPPQTEAAQGDGIGFGEMLAQSLGLAGLVDPNVVQHIAVTDDHQQQLGTEPDDLPAPESNSVLPTNRNQPANADRLIAFGTNRNAVVAAPSEASQEVPAEVTASLPDVGRNGLERTPANPINLFKPVDAEPVKPDVEPVPIKPGDGIWKPVVTGVPDQATATVASGAPVTDVVLPTISNGATLPTDNGADTNAAANAPTPRGPVELVAAEVRPVNRGDHGSAKPVAPSLPTPPSQTSTPTAEVVPDQATSEPSTPRNGTPGLFQPEIARPNQPRTKLEPRPPVDPAPPVQIQATVAAAIDAAPAHVVWPSATTQSARVNLGTEAAIRFDDPKIDVAKAAPAAPPASTPIPAVSEAVQGAVPAGPTFASVDAPQAHVAAEFAPLADPGQRSALAERVLQAVELQANQPPPRTLVVELPEIEGLRLIVSVRAGAQVHVVPTTGSSTPPSFQPFMDELSNVLADRGFFMTGDGRERGRNPQQEEQRQVPFRPQRPTFRRPSAADNDLRI